jgi:hypothetical protein
MEPIGLVVDDQMTNGCAPQQYLAAHGITWVSFSSLGAIGLPNDHVFIGCGNVPAELPQGVRYLKKGPPTVFERLRAAVAEIHRSNGEINSMRDR